MLPSTQDYANCHDRMLDRLSSKMQTTIGHRADMYIEDSEEINSDSCRIMIAYSQELGPVNTDQLEEFVIREFNGAIRPNLTTAQTFSDLGRLMVIVSRTDVSRPLDDAQNMQTVVAGAVYIDKNLADTWEVVNNDEGNAYLRRVSADNIGQIVAERRRRMAVAGVKQLTIAAAMNLYGGTYNVDAGDTVKVIYKDSVYAGCTVASVSDENVSVKIPKVGTVTVSKHAIFQIEEASPKKIAKMERELKEYYTQIYGPEYAAMLTRETTQG